ncbi:MAG: NHL repeat-containing protein [Anaerolineales bacterium]
MRLLLRFAAIFVLAASGQPAPALEQAAFMDAWADYVFGQPDFTHKLPNNGGLSSISLANAQGVALDAQGNLYIADTSNNRVLEFNAPLTTDRIADRVFGQADFTHNGSNAGGLGPSSLSGPFGVAIDTSGNLWVSDSSNNRVLEYDDPLTSDRVADFVVGQADFTHNLANRGSLISSSGFNLPLGLALDAAGNLYVAEFANHRVLEFNTPLSTNGTADRVFGQSDFGHNNTGPATLTNLAYPYAVAVDRHGNLYVADFDHCRVLEYNTPLTTNTTPDRVFGQTTFTGDSPNYSGINANGLAGPAGLVLDAQDNLYVADLNNHRVLVYNTPLVSGGTADRVFGQLGFTTNTLNQGGLSARSLDAPHGLALDASGGLYVADTSNNRALIYRSFAFRLSLPLVRR